MNGMTVGIRLLEAAYGNAILANNSGSLGIVCTNLQIFRSTKNGQRIPRIKYIYHHTYQLKEKRAIVIRYLHHSTKTEDIKQELAELGHRTRNIINVPGIFKNKETWG
jgi:hypothetical protein